ncbi:MAG: hypothetical protein ACRDR6_16855 [Pseudonocardiaceae bacterium]
MRASDENKIHLFVVLATGSQSRRHLDSAALAQHGLRVAAVDTIDELREALGQLRPDVAVVDVSLAAQSCSSWYGARARHWSPSPSLTPPRGWSSCSLARTIACLRRTPPPNSLPE